MVWCQKGTAMNRLTLSEAEELIDTHLDGFAEFEGTCLEATVLNADMMEARQIVDAYVASLGREIDPASIEIKPDRVDHMDVPCVSVIIKLEGI